MATLTLHDLGGLSLQHGDHDANRIWGGSRGRRNPAVQ